MRIALSLLLLFAASPALAEGATDAPVEAAAASPTAAAAPMEPTGPHFVPGRGFLTGDEHRFQYHRLFTGLAVRIVMDLMSIPSGVVAWDAKDWAVFGGSVGLTVAMVLPFQPHSLDVRLQTKIINTLGPDHFKIWTPYGDTLIWAAIWGSVASSLLAGLVLDKPEYVEVAALAVEAFAIAQIYASLIRLAVGREGPNDDIPPGMLVSEGRFHGPSGFVKLFPSGLPSGHVSTMYAIASVFMTYFNNPLLWVGLNTLGILFCATIITDNYHFASETVLGAALGFCIGQWVVRHRSSKFENDADGLPRRVLQAAERHVELAPLITPNGGLGALATVRF